MNRWIFGKNYLSDGGYTLWNKRSYSEILYFKYSLYHEGRVESTSGASFILCYDEYTHFLSPSILYCDD